ncbi:DUF4956 domain-containing protein [bacterium]|nr:DUF4956 domain-containing protein [bacterium]
MGSLLDGLMGYREGTGALTVEDVLLCLSASFVLGHAVSWVYVRTHRGISYSASLAQALIILALIVSLVMMIVGNNVARAFGLFGALALIRFRTPVKDARDTVFLFLAVAIGIATGTGNIMAGAVGTAVICLGFHYLAATRFGARLDHDGLLRFRLPCGGTRELAVREVLARYCDEFSLLHAREAEPGVALELSYQVKMSDARNGTQLVAEIEGLEDVSRISLLMRDEEAMP